MCLSRWRGAGSRRGGPPTPPGTVLLSPPRLLPLTPGVGQQAHQCRNQQSNARWFGNGSRLQRHLSPLAVTVTVGDTAEFGGRAKRAAHSGHCNRNAAVDREGGRSGARPRTDRVGVPGIAQTGRNRTEAPRRRMEADGRSLPLPPAVPRPTRKTLLGVSTSKATVWVDGSWATPPTE